MKRKIGAVIVFLSVILNFSACGKAMNEVDKNYQEVNSICGDTSPNGIVNEYQNWNTEEYGHIVENGFKSVATSPLSTFSADVDTASYSNVRRMINNGDSIPPDAVRIEEFINYFKYDYTEPNGSDPFSVNSEISDCPWNSNTKLLSVGLQAEKIDADDLKPSNLVFLLDVSGSMFSSDKLPLVQKSMKMLLESLDKEDSISIVTYASGDRIVLDGVRGNETAEIGNAIDRLEAYGGTNGSQGITTAYEIAVKHFIKNGNNRIILCTDGDLNIGTTSEGDLTRLVKKKSKTGVALTVLGFGTGNIKDNKMEALADNGNGNYFYIDSLIEARRVLVSEMGGTLNTVAKDVKFQTEFNPEYVKGYRLIGYENRLLNDEDFNDDTKDAGEIGSGHRVTALYELVLNGSDQEIPEVDLKYGKDDSQNVNQVNLKSPDIDSELLTVNIRYKEPDGNESKLVSVPVKYSSYSVEMSDNMLMASCAAVFGMILRDSQYKGTSDTDYIIDNLSDRGSVKDDDYKMEFIDLVKKYRSAKEA